MAVKVKDLITGIIWWRKKTLNIAFFSQCVVFIICSQLSRAHCPHFRYIKVLAYMYSIPGLFLSFNFDFYDCPCGINWFSLSSCCAVKVELHKYFVGWKWQWHYPETDQVQSLWGQPRQLPVHGLTLLAAHIEQNTNWQLGLRGTTLEGWLNNSTPLCG